MIWHILKKDLRRLAVPLAVSTALLTALTVLDAWRYDYQAGLAETVLNLLVPLSWAVLIALAVQLEPLTSDTAFWLTRPYRRTSLLLAKVAFAVLVVHIPLAVSHAAILSSHGFAPWHGELWWKQITVAAAVTVPSLAIASVTSTLAGFGWCAIAGGACALLLDATLVGRRYPWVQADWMPVALALAFLAAGAVCLVALQYARRTLWTGRIAGLGVALGAILAFSYLPRDFTSALQCSVESDLRSAVEVRFQPEGRVQAPVMAGRADRVPFALPVSVSGLEGVRHVWSDQLWVRLSGRNGRSWETRRDLGLDRRASLAFNLEQGLSVQSIVPDKSFVESAAGAPVRIEGRAALRPVRALPEKVLPSLFPQTDVPGLGRCSATLDATQFGSEMLKLVCESPAPIARLLQVRMEDPETGREWRQRLGDSAAMAMTTIAWLSPLNRRQTFLHTVQKESALPDDRWLVPREVLERSQIHIEPWTSEGCAQVNYAFDVPNLREWEVRDARFWQIR
jgi:hypothetical protein